MKKLLAASLLLSLIISSVVVAPAAETTAAPAPEGTSASAQAAAPAPTLPEEYIVLRLPQGDGTNEIRNFTDEATVRKVKNLLPNYEGGAMVNKKLTGTPIKVRYVKGTEMLPYEIYPDDLVVWYYDMKCATVKGAYATVSALLKNAPTPTEQPRVEAKEYGAGDHFQHYVFVSEPAAVQPFLDCLTKAVAVERPDASLQDGSLILSVEFIRGKQSTSYYFYDYGYIENPDTGEFLRMEDSTYPPIRAWMNLEAARPTNVTLRYQPGTFPQRRVLVPQAQGSAQKPMEDVLALLAKRTAMAVPDSAGYTGELIASVWTDGKLTANYSIFDNGAMLDWSTKQWYTLEDGEQAYETLLALIKNK